MKVKPRVKRNPKKEFDYDRKLVEQAAETKLLKSKYAQALKTIKVLEKKSQIISGTNRPIEIHRIKPRLSDGDSEATAVWVASDWHVEERVDPKVVLNLNEHGMAISRDRSEQFFRVGLRITNILAKDIEIKTIVLALLGDFITNNIHDELVEVNEVGPMHAMIHAQELIASGIQYVLDNSDYDIIIPCHSGNHARTTKTSQMGTENAHSLEYVMYLNLASWFRHEKRVKFHIADGFISYLDIYDFPIRFLHGHIIRYGGGIGGMTIPINKAIAAMDSVRQAYLTVMGHFHKYFDGGNFVVNGSQIGYNAYAMSIKASFEKPKQAMFLIDKKRGKTMTCPILYD